MAVAASAPAVTMIWSGDVGRPRSSYDAAIARLQVGEPGGVVAVPAEVGGQRRRRRRRTPRRCPAGRSRQRRPGRCTPAVTFGRPQRPVVGPGRAAGQPGEGAGAVPRLGVPAVPEHGVRPGHRRAGDPERGGEVALARQPGAVADPAVPDQLAERVGEADVGGGAVEVADEGGDPGGRNGLRHAGQ